MSPEDQKLVDELRMFHHDKAAKRLEQLARKEANRDQDPDDTSQEVAK